MNVFWKHNQRYTWIFSLLDDHQRLTPAFNRMEKKTLMYHKDKQWSTFTRYDLLCAWVKTSFLYRYVRLSLSSQFKIFLAHQSFVSCFIPPKCVQYINEKKSKIASRSTWCYPMLVSSTSVLWKTVCSTQGLDFYVTTCNPYAHQQPQAAENIHSDRLLTQSTQGWISENYENSRGNFHLFRATLSVCEQAPLHQIQFNERSHYTDHRKSSSWGLRAKFLSRNY